MSAAEFLQPVAGPSVFAMSASLATEVSYATSQRAVESGQAGHRHHRAHALRPADGGRKSYNPKNKGKKSYQPLLTFSAEMREYIWGELHNGDRPTGKQIGDPIRSACAALPPSVNQIYGRSIRGSTAGKRSRRMRNAMPGSPFRRAKPPGWSRNCAKPRGSRRQRRRAMRSANSTIGRMGGARHTGS
jgi:hypothetical protein